MKSLRWVSTALALATAAAVQAQDAPAAVQPDLHLSAESAEEIAAQRVRKWPRLIETEKGSVTVYEPQIESLEGTRMTARAALAYTPTGGEPVFGVAFFEARVAVDRDARRVDVEELSATKVRFPNTTKEQEGRHAAFLTKEIAAWRQSMSLDTVQASLAVSQRENATTKGISATPPKIVIAKEPSLLLYYDGEPQLRAIEGTSLQRVVNTPFLVVLDPDTKRHYLGGGGLWYEAPEAMGPFAPVPAPSPAVAAWIEKNPPPAPQEGSEAQRLDPSKPPRVVIATAPTEIVAFDGEPDYKPLPGGDLLYATNTDSDVFVEVATKSTWVLVSGRWYRAASLAGPWTAVRPDRLPAAFARIPPDSDKGNVLASVAGTEAAQDALADARIPQTSAVKRDAGKDLVVYWDGEPKFKAIEGTAIAYGVNSPFSVLRVESRFWVCHEGVWYVGPVPKGPWTVSDKRPPGVDSIPPSSPVYNVKYVYVYQSTPEVVYVGYTPGYVGVYPYYGSVVYGTGFYYPPYVSPYVYYPRPVTYGFHVSYNPWTGWGFGMSVSGPFMSFGVHFGGYYGPYRPPYYGGGWYGAGGYRPPPPPGYRPPGYGGGSPGYGGGRPPGGASPGGRPPTASTLPANNIYDRPSNKDRNAARPATGDARPYGPAAGTNDVYAGRDGNVYRRNDAGGWDQRAPDGWQSAGGARPSQTPAGGAAGGARPSQMPAGGAAGGARPSYGGAPAGLDRDYAARQRAAAPRSHGGGGGGTRGGGGRGGRR